MGGRADWEYALGILALGLDWKPQSAAQFVSGCF